MANIITRRGFLAGTAGIGAGLSLGVNGALAQAQGPLGVGFIYVGPVGDHGWSFTHDVGRKHLEQTLGAKVKTTFVENVAEGPDAERVIRQLATSGNGLIFTTSFGFMNPTERVARQFPNLKFEHATGYKSAPNLATYNARFYEGRAVIGTIAGHVSKSGIAGYVGSVPIPEVVMGINAFTLAARKVNPNFTTRVVWVNSWYDPGKEADAAKALLDQRADVLSQHTDSPAPLQQAEARGAFGFGQANDMKAFAPKAQLTAIVDDWADYYVSRAQAALDGSWKTHSVWYGMKEGMVKIAPYGPGVTDAARAAAEQVKADIISGKSHPFMGPIKDNKGVERVPAGKTLTDEELNKMDWYVEGVQA
ncbi:BMP family ABC transporter substrate-binding protein [Salinarimonas soli]|uniref:BMP family ABC transporter substrate-binding protein n=1 Tax=Salinarimonas soli TaxID=1638099 RepID=A0A5B2V697_9HYPH|nr:BMP family ABC transporter substrate-binding protein [Salinarimonas soli]KAA2235053.1 BMP family ABC transporter substrate-binding protein [Salinarimonas soli]